MDTKSVWTSAGVLVPVLVTLLIWGISVERRLTANQSDIRHLSDRVVPK
jgi:hypothetical protein